METKWRASAAIMVNAKRPGLTGPEGGLKWLQVGCPNPPGEPPVAPGAMTQGDTR